MANDIGFLVNSQRNDLYPYLKVVETKWQCWLICKPSRDFSRPMFIFQLMIYFRYWVPRKAKGRKIIKNVIFHLCRRQNQVRWGHITCVIKAVEPFNYNAVNECHLITYRSWLTFDQLIRANMKRTFVRQMNTFKFVYIYCCYDSRLLSFPL